MSDPFPGLEGLAGLEEVRDQLAPWLAVVQAERARILAGAQVRRRAWKNALFAGPPGSGKSRAAAALARAYHELGALPLARVYETAAPALAGSSARETAGLVHDAAQRAGGSVLLVTGAHWWRRLPDEGAQVLRVLYEELNEARHGVAVVLAGEAELLAALMGAHPPLAARFPLAVTFPAYSPDRLDRVFGVLAAEAGFTLEPAAAEKAAAGPRRRPQRQRERPPGGRAARPRRHRADAAARRELRPSPDHRGGHPRPGRATRPRGRGAGPGAVPIETWEIRAGYVISCNLP